MPRRNKRRAGGRLLIVFTLFAFLAGCGYSARAVNSGKYKTIYIEPFRNKIPFESGKSNTYLPLLEVKLTNSITDRFLFDGGIKVAKKEKADLVLQGDLIGYQRDALRYDINNDVQEYRITITIAATLWDNKQQKQVWNESSFSGDTTYFTSGTLAKSESLALEDALKDTARRVVERSVDDW